MNNWYKESKNISRIIYICRSPSGAGKSTMAKELGKGGVVFSTDDFFEKDGKYNFDPKLLGTAHKWNYERAKKAAQQGISPIVIDNTNTTLKECLNYLKLGMDFDYKVKYAYPDWHPDLRTKDGKWNYDFIMKLQEDRKKREPSKVIPPEAVKRMIDRFDYQLPGETDDDFSLRILESVRK